APTFAFCKPAIANVLVDDVVNIVSRSSSPPSTTFLESSPESFNHSQPLSGNIPALTISSTAAPLTSPVPASPHAITLLSKAAIEFDVLVFGFEFWLYNCKP